MGRNRTDVTEAELGVLRALWERGPATIRELTDALYPGGATSHYATVQKLLERLERKRCVGRRRGGTAHVFRARIARADLIDRRLQELADQLCEGSLSPLLTQLVAGRALDAEERRALAAMVDEFDRKGHQR
jgi:predicted transcriptional regulator